MKQTTNTKTIKNKKGIGLFVSTIFNFLFAIGCIFSIIATAILVKGVLNDLEGVIYIGETKKYFTTLGKKITQMSTKGKTIDKNKIVKVAKEFRKNLENELGKDWMKKINISGKPKEFKENPTRDNYIDEVKKWTEHIKENNKDLNIGAYYSSVTKLITKKDSSLNKIVEIPEEVKKFVKTSNQLIKHIDLSNLVNLDANILSIKSKIISGFTKWFSEKHKTLFIAIIIFFTSWLGGILASIVLKIQRHIHDLRGGFGLMFASIIMPIMFPLCFFLSISYFFRFKKIQKE